MSQSTRREALVSIAAAGVAAGTLVAADHEPTAFSRDEYKLLEQVVDMIIPDSDTPGAAKAGVAMTIDEDSAASSDLKQQVSRALARLHKDGFADMNTPARTALLTDYMTAGDERREFFRLLKDLTIDHYYATEVGLVQELGYQGNTYLAEYPGCQHLDGQHGKGEGA